MASDAETFTSHVLLMGDTRLVGHHGSTSVVNVIHRLLRRRHIGVVSSRARPDLVASVDTAARSGVSGIVINGEGAFHGSSEHALLFSRTVRRCEEAGLPCIVVNSVLDECDPEVIRGLRGATMMYCREDRSKRIADRYGIRAELCPDLTFALDMPPSLRWTSGNRIIVTDTTVDAINRVLHAYAKRNRFEFLPLRGRPEIASYFDRKSLARVAKFELRNRIGRVFPGSFGMDRYGRAVPTVDRFLQEVANGTRLVVSGRFHGVCLCLKLGIPFLAVASNTHKIEGMLEDAGLAHKLVPVDALKDSLSSLDTLIEAGAWSKTDEQSREDYLATAAAAITQCFDRIAAEIANRCPAS